MNFAEDGVEIFEAVLSPSEVELLRASLPSNVAGQRNLLSAIPSVRDLALSPKLSSLTSRLGFAHSRPVRAVFFDKNPGQNWKVPWHQDLSIAVAERREVAGFGPWSVKDQILHVQPPAVILARMITLRIHLDACGSDNGPLRVIPGSHRFGKLSVEQIAAQRVSREVVCNVQLGGVVAMSPLILHASSPATNPRHRRVIHIEYTAGVLPGGLQWSEAASTTTPVHAHSH